MSAYPTRQERENATHLTHNKNLSIDDDVSEGPQVNGIICTIGPASQSVEVLTSLMEAGLTIVRLNCSHGTHDYQKTTINNARKAAADLGKVIGIALDTKGPEIRTGKMAGGAEVAYKAGQKLTVSTEQSDYDKGGQDLLYVDYKNLPKVVEVGKSIFVDDGLLSLTVDEIQDTKVICTVKNNACVSDHKGVNLPNTKVDLPAVSEKDKSDLKFCAEQGLDMVFASFIRKPEDVAAVREAIGDDKIFVISKIENHEGVRNFDAICKVSDGIMVARGDLGIEIPPEKVFVAQKMMISTCNLYGKPAICATQMLESMTVNPRPTRAETSDVANAVLDGADCVMLSGETAKGKYPKEAVAMMNKISRQADACHLGWQHYNLVKHSQPSPLPPNEVVAQSAVHMAYEQEAPAIVVLTNSGDTGRLISKYHPRCPIYCVTTIARTARQLLLTRACIPVLQEKDIDKHDYNGRVAVGIDRAKKDGTVTAGTKVIVVHADGSHSVPGANLVRIVQVQ
eukprot:TRINITY_DN20798_c0_g1_i1.p1 TRINITY_DN20798_c0_g1~~TRINITY_DN20798_c0_g1_i1.p1  ORF type:complete len:517 (-),score=72.85 TRINITY_DN20798_c0_g1_i1:941-2470(-)